MSLRCKTVFVALAESEDNKLKIFYQQLFEQDPVVEIPNVYAEFQLPGLRLGLFHPNSERQTEFAALSSGGMSFCIEVEELEGAITHLTAIGYPPPGQIQQASHGREIYAYDPCGDRLILHETTKNFNHPHD
jgi:hypothetical protein